MFKKLKDKLAEEVKSSPQRIQQFAQAAQAAVTSASSSISDITNNDLFSIGDNDAQQSRAGKSEMPTNSQRHTFQEVSLTQPSSTQNSIDPMDFSSHDFVENQRQRRLSNSSFASDVSFRLPSYESPSMFHLQSDMEVSASEAEERSFSGGNVSLDRVTKEQIYAAYRRTQERYTKYRTQYADLARHYKLLERENAKARSVLVETQDKALRRISELREQCSLEQSAKAHLEKALRVEIEEKNMKIETLNTKIQLLQNSDDNENEKEQTNKQQLNKDNEAELITLVSDNDNDNKVPEQISNEVQTLNNKIEKLEQLVNKYKDSLKQSKEKTHQLTADLQKANSDIENKTKEINELKAVAEQLTAASGQLQELIDLNEELQNKINAYDFNKTKEMSTLEMDLQKSQEEIEHFRSKIEVFNKREEEYAISLAENKLSIHKELESKENEIKSLNDSLSAANNEVRSLKIVVNDYKTSIASIEEEKLKLINEITELSSVKGKSENMDRQLQALTKKCQSLETLKAKAGEELKILQLQIKQETAEKLAMIDRNTYLESRNTQLSEDYTKKTAQLKVIEQELQILKENEVTSNDSKADSDNLLTELDLWKTKYSNLESEIQEERDELVKLQTEIEKLLINHEAILVKNSELNDVVNDLKSENETLKQKVDKIQIFKSNCDRLLKTINELKEKLYLTSKETRSLKEVNNNLMPTIQENMNLLLNSIMATDSSDTEATVKALSEKYNKNKIELKAATVQYDAASKELCLLQEQITEMHSMLSDKEEKCDELQKEIDILNEKYHNESNELKKSNQSNDILKQKLNEAENSCSKLQNIIDRNDNQTKTELKTITEQFDAASNEINLLQNQIIELRSALSDKEAQYEKLQKKTNILNEKYHRESNELKSLGQSNEILKQKLQESDNNCLKLQNVIDNKDNQIKTKLKTVTEQFDTASNEINLLQNQKIEIRSALSDKVAEFDELQKEITILNEKYLEESNELKNVAESNEILKQKQRETENNCLKLQNIIDNNDREKIIIKQNIESLEVEKEKLLNALTSNEAETISLKKQYEQLNQEVNQLKMERDELKSKAQKYDERNMHTAKLEQNVMSLEQENISLKHHCEKIANNFKDLELEIADVQKSHAEIEVENERLNKVLEALEKSAQKIVNSTDTQTDDTKNSTEIVVNAVTYNEINAQPSDNLPSVKLSELLQKYEALKETHNSQKEENRRLQSDIAGLQAYLTKISKENGELNDKLRESMASSETSPYRKDSLSNDISALKIEIQTTKDKVEELMHENTLLIDENLELKDQISNQNFSPVPTVNAKDNKEYLALKEKFNSLLDTKNSLEKKLADLEEVNFSVGGNMTMTQQQNDKLKLTNEKLERRLDEALVSLRHLHSLQENTELEYLRNILYEYLTGNGTHSETLAKVLAAVVKFDDNQTKQVLQKEKERQGLLRQLGLL